MSAPTPGGTTESVTVEQATLNLLSLLPADSDTDETSEPQAANAPDATDDPTPEPDAESDEPAVDGETEADTPAPEPRKLKVKLGDLEEELPEDEVVKGYMRNADYTRKTQAAAELRKSLEAEAAAVKAERSQLATQLAEIKTALDTHLGQEPDWDTLRMGDPATFAAKYSEWDLGQKNRAKVEAAQQELARRNALDEANARSEHLKAESEKLKDLIPSWKDDAVAKAEKTEIVNYARAKGYSDAELSAVSDHRIMGILRDGMLGAKASSAKPAIKAKIDAVKVAPPGAPAATVRPKDKAIQEAAKRVAKTGKLDDAVDWLIKATS